MTALLLSALLFQSPQASARWTDVMALAPASEVRVSLGVGAVIGTLVSATSDGLVIRTGRRDIPLNKTSIQAVDRAEGKPHRGRNAGIGAFVGMGEGHTAVRARQ